MFSKIFMSALLAFSAAIASLSYECVSAGNAVPISIYVNEAEIKSDVSPFIVDGVTLVPVRSICSAMGIDDILWNEADKTVTISHENKIQFTIGEKYAFKNGRRYDLNAAAVIENNRTMIPLRFLAEGFGADVNWDSTFYTVDIFTDNKSVPLQCIASDYEKSDLVWLSKIVEAESVGEPEDGQLAVANVVLNRVKSREYPDTVYGVVFDTRHSVQFEPVLNGTIYNTPSKKCVLSAKRAINGENNISNCLFFLNEKIATNTWIIKNRDYYTTIKNHSFYM